MAIAEGYGSTEGIALAGVLVSLLCGYEGRFIELSCAIVRSNAVVGKVRKGTVGQLFRIEFCIVNNMPHDENIGWEWSNATGRHCGTRRLVTALPSLYKNSRVFAVRTVLSQGQFLCC